MALALAFSPATAAAEDETPDDGSAGLAGPVTTALGVAVMGGGAGILVAAEDPGVTIAGSLIGALGIAGLMGGTAYWMMDDLTEVEAEDKIRQGGVALTTLGVGAGGIGGFMVLSSFVDASDVSKPSRIAGIITASAGGASLITGLIMYGVGGPPPQEKAAWQPEIDVGAGSAHLTLRF